VLKDKNILYIVHKYNSFQKDPIEEAAKYFNKVYVLVRYKPISSIIKYLPMKWLKVFDESIVIDLRGLPQNVEVIKTPVWYLPFGFLNRWLGDLHFRSVARVISKQEIKFDIIHSHFIWSSGYVGMKLKEKYNVPLVVTGHGFDVYRLPFKDDYWREKIQEIINSADKILTVSEFNKKHLLKLHIPDRKISIVHNGYSTENFSPQSRDNARKDLGIDTGRKICVSVGNLEKVKGFDILIKAIGELTENGFDIECYIIGDGSQGNKLRELISKLRLEDRVFLVGFKPHDQVGKWINSADLFVISSRIESASVVLLEALACGKPVVATEVGIVPLVLKTDCGIIVKAKTPHELGISIKDALGREWDSAKITKCASTFSWENSVRQIIDIYKILLND